MASSMYPQFYQLSETAIGMVWGQEIEAQTHAQVLTLNQLLLQNPFPGFIESVPGYASLTIYFALEKLPAAGALTLIKNHVEGLKATAPQPELREPNVVSIPVCYDDSFGPDLEFLAESKGISKANLIELHQQQAYKVYMMGFLPGFVYLGKVPDSLATTRKATPRAIVEAGSVGIAGNQTGIYPLKAPGGWQIIGRTPLRMFNPSASTPFLLKTGDWVRFQAIDKAAFQDIENKQAIQAKSVTAVANPDALLLKSGPYTTIQDRGRYGFRAYGVPLAGAMDQVAHQVANALLGNPPEAATLECTMGGLQLQFYQDSQLAIAGGGLAFINQKNVPLYQVHTVCKGDLLEIRFNNEGLRSYLAVAGGFVWEDIMDSKSMSPLVGIGAPLSKGMGLFFGPDAPTGNPAPLPVPPGLRFKASQKRIRVLPGPEQAWLEPSSVQALYTQVFTLTNRCDRMGCHLQSEPLPLRDKRELLSTAVSKGSIQRTPNGQLIVLMSDCQTTGGYPRVGQIAAVDLPLMAQLIPGASIRFEMISFAEAETLLLAQQADIDAIYHRPEL